MGDDIKSLIEILEGDSEIIEAQIHHRIFGGQIPERSQDAPRQRAVLLKYAGGSPIGGYVKLRRFRLDVVYYGASLSEADTVYRTVHPVLRAINGRVQCGVIIHSLTEESGPISMIEPKTNWPCINTSWQVLSADLPPDDAC